MTFLQQIRFFLEHGGTIALLTAFSGVILILLSIEKLYFLYMGMSFSSREALDGIRDLILNRRYTQALQICNQQSDAPELVVIKSGLMSVENGREAMRAALSESVLRISHKCEARLQYISLIASGATLLGLLGTIAGLVKTFSGLGSADASEKARLLGLGIAEAMYSTAAGLLIGLLAMVLHTICVSKVDTIIGKLQSAGLNFCNWVEQAERVKRNG